MLITRSLVAALLLVTSACQKGTESPKPADDKPAASDAGATTSQPGAIPPPPDVAAPPADADKTASGLASKVLSKGTGTEHPTEWDQVKVHYTGWTTDGKMFDSSVPKDRPATFALRSVIPGWTQGVPLMTKGEKRRFWIPQELAYQGKPGAPAGMLVFEIELLDIIPGPKPIPAPEDVAAPPAKAKKTKSGLAYVALQKASGKADKPGAQDTVRVHYTGWTTDGTMFDSSVMRERPATFRVSGVIAGWTEGLQLMRVGDKFRMWIPEELAYKGQQGRPQGMLVFDIELLEVKKAPKPIPAPSDVAKAPKSAATTDSGLAYKVLTKGKGTVHPGPNDTVEVHYTGWTTDGNMFDSSVARGAPATFPLSAVIPGWTEGLQLMVEGEKARLWIPEELAYKGRPGRPQGMLVFDVELLTIHGAGATAPAAE
jgi:FKBP-type peptidyl-prolyl cis-trans isomerase